MFVGRWLEDEVRCSLLTLWLVVGNCVCVLALPDIPQCKAELEAVPRGVTSTDDGADFVIAADIDGWIWSRQQKMVPRLVGTGGTTRREHLKDRGL